MLEQALEQASALSTTRADLERTGTGNHDQRNIFIDVRIGTPKKSEDHIHGRSKHARSLISIFRRRIMLGLLAILPSFLFKGHLEHSL